MSKKRLAFLVFISLVAVFVRYIGIDYVSTDMSSAFIPWYNVMKARGGIAALSEQVGDYSLLYQTIIALFTYVDINPLYLYKIFPICFDFLLAASVAFFVTHCGSSRIIEDRERLFTLAYAYALLLPTVVLNASFYGQCDSIYTFFLLWSIWFLYKEDYHLSFFMLGWALAFKLQSVLLFPLFFYYYFANKKFSLANVLITFITFWLSGFVAYTQRLHVTDNATIYSNQVAMFKHMWMNVPSFWFFVGDDYEKWHIIAIAVTFLILALVFIGAIKGKFHMVTFEDIVAVAVFTEWTCIIFLPAMHDRYTYVLDLLLLTLSFLDKKYITYTAIAVLSSCLTYSSYFLSHWGIVVINLWLVTVYVMAWLCYTYVLFNRMWRR